MTSANTTTANVTATAGTPAATKETFLQRISEVRVAVEAELETLGENGLAMFEQEIASGQFTGILAPLQPDFQPISEVINFLSFVRNLIGRLYPSSAGGSGSSGSGSTGIGAGGAASPPGWPAGQK